MIRMTQQHLLFQSRDRDPIHHEFVSPLTLSIVVQYQQDAMAQDPESMDDFPPVVSPDGSGAHSPCRNVHLKHEYSACTTQAPPAAITDISPGLNGSYSPTKVSPTVDETRLSGSVASSSHNQGDRTDRPERGGSSPTLQQLSPEHQFQYAQYHLEDTSQRMQGLRSSHSTDFDDYNLGKVSKPAVGSVSTSRPSLGYNVNNCSDRTALYDFDGQDQPVESWTPWENFTAPQEASYHQLFYHPSRFVIPSSAEEAQPTSSSYSTSGERSGQPYDNARDEDLGFPPMRGTYKHPNPAAGTSMTSLSPCSNTLAITSDAICKDREDTAPLSPDPDIEMDADMVYNPSLYDAEDVLGSRSSTEPAGGKSDEPYAQLIYRAFLSRPNKSMTLQEIYQWFRENTDKAKSTGKGWQNSIRHNLSMNGAFTKRASNQAGLNSDGSLSLDASGADGRKSTEWYLEPGYYGGVESTTRYRKGNSKSAVRSHRSDRTFDGNTKAVSGRKGGVQAAQNRKRVKAEQQQEAARQRIQRLQRCGPPYYAEEDGHYYAEYPPQLPPNTSSAYYTQAQLGLTRSAGISPSRQSPLSLNYFYPQDLGNARDTHRMGLSGDLDHSTEPTTPPGSAHDSPVDDVSYGAKFRGYLPGFIANPDRYPFQQPPPATSMSPADYAQQQGYTLEQVTGIFEPPSGIETSLFIHGSSLTAEEAAALIAANPAWANTSPYCG
ncbi:hypothetical protein J7T55_003174 [Diaporthe amygdali]|uniref:uncharacterized protein n=1 Tax=Phomopsis amygdali TaxID=1214568 RepID=UPI0022FE1F47|nr:uncharacterized protein J7T55_003174 [Diaporthe amygdali]KAJ0122659.1 hypothetical protein J7T55_003174 [Diaporthe amygdali]